MTEGLQQFGLAGVLVFMTFQYVIKPIVASALEKRKKANGTSHNPGPEVHKMLEVLTKCDDKDRPLVWGYCQKEAIDGLRHEVHELNKNIRTLIAKID